MVPIRYHLPMDDMANCIVISGQRAGEERVCAALVLGTTRADVNGLVRRPLVEPATITA